MSITKKIPLDVSLYIRLLYQENKPPICAIRRRYLERKTFPNSSFSNNFCHCNLNNKETFLLCFDVFKLWFYVLNYVFKFLSLIVSFCFMNIHNLWDGRGRGGYYFDSSLFYPLHRHLDISWVITAESSLLRIGSSQTGSGNP